MTLLPIPLYFSIYVCQEVTKGVKEYFNAMLGCKLLYKEERQQYNKIVAENPDAQPSAIYGPHHLLRLFGNLSILSLSVKVRTDIIFVQQGFSISAHIVQVVRESAG